MSDFRILINFCVGILAGVIGFLMVIFPEDIGILSIKLIGATFIIEGFYRLIKLASEITNKSH